MARHRLAASPSIPAQLLLALILTMFPFSASHAASPGGTTIPNATQIVDARGHVWKQSGGLFYNNGAAKTGPITHLLLYYKNTIYAVNTGNAWYRWTGSGWTGAAGNPEPPSASGAVTTPSGAALIDGSGVIWTVDANGLSYENGIADTGANITLLLYYNTGIYAKVTNGSWWEHINGGWTPIGGDPRLSQATPSQSGATIPPASQIVDGSGTVWTVVNGLSSENGTADGGANITLLLYYNGTIYANTTSYGWFSHGSGGWASISGDPRPPSETIFGFVNGITNNTGPYIIGGWACVLGNPSAISTDLYVGGPAGTGTFIGNYPDNAATGSAVASACNSTGTNYGFYITLAASTLQQYGGQPIYIYGHSADGQTTLLPASAALKVPFDTIRGFINGITNNSGPYVVGGWTCVLGNSNSISADLYIGGPVGTGTFIGNYPDNAATGSAVADACNSTGTNYGFYITLAASTLQEYGGQPIYIYGHSADGQTTLLPASAALSVPSSGALTRVSRNYISGWVCPSLGNPVSVYIFATNIGACSGTTSSYGGINLCYLSPSPTPNPYNPGYNVNPAVANISQPATASFCNGANDGFEFQVPPALLDGQDHQVYAFTSPAPSSQYLLPGAPITFNAKNIANGLNVWFAPATESPDYYTLFADLSDWNAARSQITAWNFSWNTLQGQGINTTFSGLNSLDAFRKLHSWDIAITATEAAVKPWDCSATGPALSETLSHITNMYNAGGTIDAVAYDEPLWAGIGAGNCGLTLSQTAVNTANNAKAIQASAATADAGFVPVIGDIEPYPSFSVSQLEQWVQALESNGFKPAFFQLDICVGCLAGWSPQQLAGANLTPDLQALASFFKAQGIPFGVIIWPGYDPLNSDAAYYSFSMSLANNVKAAIGLPDQTVFISWITRSTLSCDPSQQSCISSFYNNCNPATQNCLQLACTAADPSYCGLGSIPLNLPENNPALFPHTRLINDALTLLRN